MFRGYCEKISTKNSINDIIDKVKVCFNQMETMQQKGPVCEADLQKNSAMSPTNSDEIQDKFDQQLEEAGIEDITAAAGHKDETTPKLDEKMKKSADRIALGCFSRPQLDTLLDCLQNASEVIERIEGQVNGELFRLELSNVEFVDKKANKWNMGAVDGEFLTISEDGLTVTRGGPTAHKQGHQYNTVLATVPFPKFKKNANKPNCAIYFEVEIIKYVSTGGGIHIGFSSEFPFLAKVINPGWWPRSISFRDKVMRVDGSDFVNFGNNPYERDFKEGDVIGIGVLYSPATDDLKCFCTCNGELFGSIYLEKFEDYTQIFPAIALWKKGDTIRAIFAKEQWRFNPRRQTIH